MVLVNAIHVEDDKHNRWINGIDFALNRIVEFEPQLNDNGTYKTTQTMLWKNWSGKDMLLKFDIVENAKIFENILSYWKENIQKKG